MLIKMLETRRGTEDGFTVRQYRKGDVYEIRDHLALAFLAAGAAIKVRTERSVNKKAKPRKKIALKTPNPSKK